MKSFKFFYSIILICILILFIESYINYYHFFFDQIIPIESRYNTLYRYTKSHRDMALITNLIWSENGLVENIQILFLFFSIIYFYSYLKKDFQLIFKFSVILKYLFFFGILYYFFEEISWGQHFFHWKSPMIFNDLNHQNETNLHNINNIFNQLPRNLLTIWSSLSFFVINLRFINLNQSLSFFIYPSKELKYISFLIIFFTLSKKIFGNYFDFINIHEISTLYENNRSNAYYWFEWGGKKTYNNFYIILIIIMDFLKFKFLRFSELQELLFSYYILSHSYYLNKKQIN